MIGQDALQESAAHVVGNTIVGAGLWAAPGLEVYFHNGTSGAPTSIRSDVLVVHNLRYLGEAELEAMATGTKHVVLAGGLPWKLRAFVRSGVRHAVFRPRVRDHGAFVCYRLSALNGKVSFRRMPFCAFHGGALVGGVVFEERPRSRQRRAPGSCVSFQGEGACVVTHHPRAWGEGRP